MISGGSGESLLRLAKALRLVRRLDRRIIAKALTEIREVTKSRPVSRNSDRASTHGYRDPDAFLGTNLEWSNLDEWPCADLAKLVLQMTFVG